MSAWILAAMLLLAPGRDHTALANAIAARIEAERPLFESDENRKRSAAFLTAIAFRESSFRNDAIGDHGSSHCAFQVHLPNGQKTAEGWTGADLREDPSKCVTVAMRILRDSMRWCPAFPLAIYASGPKGCRDERAQRISRDRLAVAARLVREVTP